MVGIIEEITDLGSPVLATAIHNGHHVRSEALEFLELDEYSRLREEDPYTEVLAGVASNRLISMTSRFEVDLNRSRDEAIYRSPAQSWGLKVWKDDVPLSLWEDSLKRYDDFYLQLDQVIRRLIEHRGYVIVYDIHTYNYRREEVFGKESDPAENPDVNVGTATLDRNQWGHVADTFMAVMKKHDYFGKRLSVAENVRFKGGYMGRWIHARYPGQSCVLSIEFKKIFMDEWTGAVDVNKLFVLKKALEKTISPVLESAGAVKVK